MNFEQFDKFIEYGEFRQFVADDGQAYVGVLPRQAYYERKVSEIADAIVAENGEYPIQLEKFMKLAQEYTPLRNQKITEAFEVLNTKSPEEISRLSPNKRLEILERIIPPQPTLANINKLKPHAAKIEQLMFDLKFPPQFWKDEERLASSFVNRLQLIPHLKENIADWQQLETARQQQCIQKIADVFCKTYGIEPIKITFFTLEEFNRDRVNQGLDPVEIPPTGQASAADRSINFCADRIKICDNYVPIYLTFHEALHISQQERDFPQYPLVERMFAHKFDFLKLISDKAYLLEPSEIHAYHIDSLVQNKAQETLKVPFVANKYDAKTRKAVDLAKQTAAALYAHNIKE